LKFVVGTLNEKQRKTMVLHFFDGLEVETIAAALGETVGNTRNHLYRGLANLRSRLMQNQLLAGYIEFAEVRSKERCAVDTSEVPHDYYLRLCAMSAINQTSPGRNAVGGAFAIMSRLQAGSRALRSCGRATVC